jgi:hypothetical protein
MTNVNWSQLTAWTGTADGSNDLIAYWKNTNSTLYKASRNQVLDLTSHPVGINDTQTLTAKTLTSPTISGPTLSGTIIGTYTIGGTPTFPSSVVTLTGSQTLTNKILTSPTINSPTITNATLSADAVTGYSASTTGTVYGVSIASGKLAAGALGNNAVATSNITDGAVTASKLATAAITLGYAEITSNFVPSASGTQDVTGLSVTVTVPAGGRDVKITVKNNVYNSSIADNIQTLIREGATTLDSTQTTTSASNRVVGASFSAHLSAPSAGSHTYKVSINSSSAAQAVEATSTEKAYILVEAI